MSEVTTDGDTTVKLSKKALKGLEGNARPFESKKDCLERIIMQSCSPSRKESDVESEEKAESEDE